jgi:glycine hydroxymethyltransferase
VKADITVNKNMVPFDDKSPFVTSGIRLGTAAVTTRGLGLSDMEEIAAWIDAVISEPQSESVRERVKAEVNRKMGMLPLFHE